jgi:hypothetical protein|nr:hypothetical protein [Kofleriaceae bacterium]
MARTHYPSFVRGAAGLGVARLGEVASAAGVAVPATATAEQLAAALLSKLDEPAALGALITADDLEAIGRTLGLGDRATWKSKLSAAAFEALPFYRKPSYDQDVLDALVASGPAPEPTPRAAAKRVASKAFPELASLAAWLKLTPAQRAAVGKRLAKALPGYAAGKPALAGELQLPVVRHGKLGVDFVAVPGGKLAMGVSAGEQRELGKLAKAAGSDAEAAAKELVARAKPAHDVKVLPFVVATRPLTRAQLTALGADVADELPGDLARTTGPDAARAVAASKLRLPSEAEWEWLARAGGARCWLSGDRTASEWAELHARGEADAHPLAVDGLGWGDWVDDGWHATYRGAPATTAAWQPAEWPTVARGGALARWPWQAGDVVACHAAARQHDPDGRHCVRLALDLP